MPRLIAPFLASCRPVHFYRCLQEWLVYLIIASVLSTTIIVSFLHSPASRPAVSEDGLSASASHHARGHVTEADDYWNGYFKAKSKDVSRVPVVIGHREQQQGHITSSVKTKREQAEVVSRSEAVEACVLLISAGLRSVTAHNARVWLESFRIKVTELVASKDGEVNLGELVKVVSRTDTHSKPLIERVGLYALVVIDDGGLYLKIPQRLQSAQHWQRKLDQYCAEFSVGQILFPGRLTTQMRVVKTAGWLFAARPLVGLTHASLASSADAASFLHVSKAGNSLRLKDHKTLTLVFTAFDKTYSPLEVMWRDGREQLSLPKGAPLAEPSHKYTTVMLDRGLRDGVKRVFFGRGLFFWIHKMLLLDAVTFLAPKYLLSGNPGRRLGNFGLDRYVGIDIDDVFGTVDSQHMHAGDVKELIQLQQNLSLSIEGFRFQLGFVAGKYKSGNREDIMGDTALQEASKHFLWFDHAYEHYESRWFTSDKSLDVEMMKSYNFSKNHNLPLVKGYAIAPRHAGIYPVDSRLFRVWKKVWNISVTATEEYPHLKPASRRRGFIFQGTKVLPRQTCGLFTTTNYIDSFPGGQSRLKTFIEGGELFLTILRNPVSLFMTHANNYANDRLAHTVFLRLVEFVRDWTNLRLKWSPPQQAADYYFSLFSEDKEPLWENPCTDERHLSMWNHKASACRLFPSLLLIGPPSSLQLMHSLVHLVQRSAADSAVLFRGCQRSSLTSEQRISVVKQANVSRASCDSTFFSSDELYGMSLEVYLSQFPVDLSAESMEHVAVGEASSTYFFSSKAPERARALLPASTVAIMLPPLAQSLALCCLEQSSQTKKVLSGRFRPDVVSQKINGTMALDQCLSSNNYTQRLVEWMEQFGEEKIIVLDADSVVSTPQSTLESVASVFNDTQFKIDSRLKWVSGFKSGEICLTLHNVSANLGCFSTTLITKKSVKTAGSRHSDHHRTSDGKHESQLVGKLTTEISNHYKTKAALKALQSLMEHHPKVRKVGKFAWLAA